VAPLGAGGMGEVYRACDTKLDRDVALKILPESFANDPDRLMRFEREAKTLASLNHPNIAAIYGIEDNALVMELVEGRDLSEVIANGGRSFSSAVHAGPEGPASMPIDDALPIARQIAEALEAAHDAGIVHRDLKPANVKVRDDGTVKVLDFGLAKAMAPAGPEGPASNTLANSPTMTSPALTTMGLILGTAAYMSPEQAKGKPVDRRADIWAFGVVLYEMLSGRRAFEGEDVSDLLVAVLSKDVDWSALPATTPTSILTLLRRCLERDPKRRLRDIGEARLILAHPEQAVPTAIGNVLSTPVSFASRPALALLTVLAAACIALAWLWLQGPSSALQPDAASVRFPLVSDPSLRVDTAMTQPFAVSPDGRTIVFSGDDGRGAYLWVRTLDAVAARRLEGTEGGMQPAISPDGEWVAFVVANYQIRKVRLSGGIVSDIASIDNVTAALTWLSNDEIAFEMIGTLDGIHRVNVNGGAPAMLIPLDKDGGERSQRRPVALRDEGMLLYTSSADDGGVSLAAFSLTDGRRVRLNIEGTQALGVIDGHLIYSREDGVLMAVPFDATAMQRRGEARQLLDQVERTGMGTGVSLSQNGTLVFAAPGAMAARLFVRNAAGQTTPVGDKVRAFDVARFSPGADRVAVSIGDGDHLELWVIDRASAEATRVTSGEYDRLVDWTDDGKSLIFLRNWQIWITPVDRSVPPRQLVTLDGRIAAAARVPKGQSVVAVRMNQGPLSGLSLVSMNGGAETPILGEATSGRRPRPVDARVSPDGQWVAYTDRNEQEVHVRALNGTGSIQISVEGGTQPIWGPDSRQVFYRIGGDLMMARFQTALSPKVTRSRVGEAAFAGAVQDVAPNGTAFLVVERVGQGPVVFVAFDWAGDVRRQLRK
ncbi:MAG TPA: protein kinase, partial [Vicinamibacterales bacterium]|nr:protein kinase [Vicinamibacterales bacterium]